MKIKEKKDDHLSYSLFQYVTKTLSLCQGKSRLPTILHHQEIVPFFWVRSSGLYAIILEFPLKFNPYVSDAESLCWNLIAMFLKFYIAITNIEFPRTIKCSLTTEYPNIKKQWFYSFSSSFSFLTAPINMYMAVKGL